MNLSSHLLQGLLRLDPPSTMDLIVQRDLRVPMADGVDQSVHHDGEHPSAVILPVRQAQQPV